MSRAPSVPAPQSPKISAPPRILHPWAGALSYLSAYHQISHLYLAGEARRRALGATVGPLAFYGVLGGLLYVGVPLMVHA